MTTIKTQNKTIESILNKALKADDFSDHILSLSPLPTVNQPLGIIHYQEENKQKLNIIHNEQDVSVHTISIYSEDTIRLDTTTIITTTKPDRITPADTVISHGSKLTIEHAPGYETKVIS